MAAADVFFVRPKSKYLFLTAAALAVVSFILFPHLARWIDARVEPRLAEASAFETQFREMTNAFPKAAELPPGHPTVELWRQRREALLAARYLETRKVQMTKQPNVKNWIPEFFSRFAARWPGIERKVIFTKAGEPPTIEITARGSDFGAIEKFIRNYDPNSFADRR